MVASAALHTPSRPVGAADIPLIFFAPGRLFRRVENVSTYGWPLAILLTLVTLLGYAKIETGLIDREVERSVQASFAKLDFDQADVVARSEMRKQMEDIKKSGEFTAFLTRMGSLVFEPVRVLSTVLLLSALFYGLVALSGRKPEWSTLLNIAVFASFINLLRMTFELVLMVQCRTLNVDTSLGSLIGWVVPRTSETAQLHQFGPLILSGFDPFRIWFWIVVVIGLKTTSQLRGWRAVVPCVLCWLAGAGLRAGMKFSTAEPTAEESNVRIEVSQIDTDNQPFTDDFTRTVDALSATGNDYFG